MARPGGSVTQRPLHFIWIADCSGSMNGAKIQTLNRAIREAIPYMIDAAEENPHAKILVRAIRFSNGATWHIATPTEVKSFKWKDLKAKGYTDMGKALKMVAAELLPDVMGVRGLPPVLVLLSDGQPTDDFNSGLRQLTDSPWGQRAVRIAIAIGSDADLDVLHRFMGGHVEVKPLEAKNADDLVNFIKWASTVPLQVASSPKTTAPLEGVAKAGASADSAPPVAAAMPPPPESTADNDDPDVW